MKSNYPQLLFLHLISLIFLFLVTISFFPQTATKLIGNTGSFGDLYQMSKIKDFKIKLPSLHPLPQFSSVKDSDLIIMGDSFFNVGIGTPVIGQQLQNSLKTKVHNYNIQGSGEIWRKTNPLDYLTQINFTPDTKKRILILESVDRGIVMRFHNINLSPPNIPTPTSTPTPIAKTPTNNHTLSPNTTSQKNTDNNSPIGSIDGLTYQYHNNTLSLHGWAADYESGTPLTQVNILVNDISIGSAKINLTRPDVAIHYNKNDWTQAGWSFSIPLKLSPGRHLIIAKLTDINGNTGQSIPKTLWINPFKKLKQPIDTANQLIKKQLKSLEYLISQNIIGRNITEIIATTNFYLFKKISPLTPKYSLNPKYLFYQDSVNFNLQTPNSTQINIVANNLKYISDQLKEIYNIDLIFIPMPTKYTIYKHLTGDQDKTVFFQQLFDNLDKLKVNYVDLYTPFTASTQSLFLPSDTHWNKNGVELATQTTINKINQILQDQ